jgi:tRNA 2-thiouridine synthesizing protein C
MTDSTSTSSTSNTPTTGRPNKKKMGIILSHAPYGNNLAHEALDVILTASAYDQDITIFFTGDGVFQLLSGQESRAAEQKSIEKKLMAFEMYDIHQVFVCKESLNKRQLAEKDLSISVNVIEREELSKLIHQQNTLLSF